MPQLKKIKSINNYRNFLNFNSNEDISKHEIIYAPNGSGKTHLSRLFRILRDQNVNLNTFRSKESEQEDTVKFELMFDSTIINRDNYKTTENQEILDKVLVFNNDYTAKNIICPDFKDKKLDGDIVIELGAEDANISKIKQTISNQEGEISKELDSILLNHKEQTTRLKESKYSPNERNIWSAFNITEILTVNDKEKSKSHFNFEKIKQINSKDYSTAEQRREELLLLGDASKMHANQPLPTLDLEAIGNELRKSTTFPTTDDEITNSVQLIINFLRQYVGIQLSPTDLLKQAIKESEESGHCLLCNRELNLNTKELFTKYKKLLADEKTKYEEKLTNWQAEVNNLKKELEKLTNTQEREANRICALLQIDKQWDRYDTKKTIGQLDELYNAIDRKIVNSKNEIKINPDLKNTLNSLEKQIIKNNKLISRINKSMEDASGALAKARTEVGEKELQLFIQKHEKQINSIHNSQNAIDELVNKLTELKKKAPKRELRQQICDLFNFFMENRLGIEKYKAEIISQQITIKLNNFDISESMEVISDGEKTMMGLAYFIASSIQKLNSSDAFSDAIFIIDDPVSSISYSNIFGISTLLPNFQNDIQQKVWGKNSIQSGQTIILTHNIQFFNIIRTQIWNDKRIKESTEGQQNPKDGYALLNSNTLKKMEKGHLLSDFEASLLSIYQANKSHSSFNACNSIRRVFEILKHFYGIKGSFSAESLKKIFPYIVNREYDAIYKTINFFSHGSANSIDMLPPEVTEKAVEEFINIFSCEESPFLNIWASLEKLDICD